MICKVFAGAMYLVFVLLPVLCLITTVAMHVSSRCWPDLVSFAELPTSV